MVVGTLQGGWFLKKEQDDTHTDHQLILPEGNNPLFNHYFISSYKQEVFTVHRQRNYLAVIMIPFLPTVGVEVYKDI